MSGRIETPEEMAERIASAPWRSAYESTERRLVAADAIRKDRKQIVAWCIEKAAEADREAAAHSDRERVARCEGQASALKALAAKLGGAS